VKHLLIPIVVLCIGSSAFAQQKVYIPQKMVRDTSTFWIFKELTLGPYFTGGFARENGEIPKGWLSEQTFAYTFGGTIDGSITNWIGLNFSLLFDSRDISFTGDSSSIDLNINYVALQPSIRLAWFLLGFAFDIPMSGAANETVAYLPKTKGRYAGNLNADTKDLSFLTELRGTVSIPLLQSESGMLHFIFSANYPLNKTLTGSATFDTTGSDNLGNRTPMVFSNLGKGKLPTVEAGLSYQFDILH
jgi:hypothetical protein